MILGSRREGQGGHPPWPLLSGGAAQWAVMRLEWHKPRGQKVKDSREHMFGFECAVRSFTKLLLLLLLSCFSRVRLCETPQTTANQAPPSLGFSRQEHWSGLPFPSPISKHRVSYIRLPGGSDGKESTCNAGDQGSILGLGRSPGEGNGSPLYYSCLENPMDGRAW